MIGAVQAAMMGGSLRLGPELLVNGTFDSDITSWQAGMGLGGGSYSWDDGKLKGTRITQGSSYTQSFTTTVGKSYLVAGHLVSGAGSSALLVQNSKTAFGPYLLYLGISAETENQFYKLFVATETTTWVHAFVGNTAGNVCYFDNFSVKEIL